MNPYQHIPINPPIPYPPGVFIAAPPIPPPPQMGLPPYPPYLPQPPPQGVPVARYASSFVSMPPIPAPSLIASTSVRKIEDTTTTVYVGKIPSGVEDDFVRKLLEACGEVALWRRVSDPSSGQLKGFAFCDFKSPEGVLRALRLLNGLTIDGQNLLLKVDEKNQKLLDAYTTRRNAEQHGIVPKPGQVVAQTAEALAKEREDDEAVRTSIKEFVDKQHTMLANRRAGKDGEEGHANGDDKSSLVSREIKNFRERQAQKDLEKKDKQREEEDRDVRDRDIDRQKERDRLRLLRERERERDTRRKQREEKDYRDKEKEWELREKKKEIDREDEKKGERREKETRAQEIIEQENEDEEYTRKRIRSREARKRRLREREDDENDKIKEREEIEHKRREEEEKRKQEELKQQQLAQVAAEEAKVQNEKRRMDELQQQRVKVQQQKRAVQSEVDGSVSSPPLGDENRESLKLGFNSKRPKLAPSAGFAPEVEEDDHAPKKKRAFVPLAYPEDKMSRKEEVQNIIDKIPTGKEGLFAVEINWPLIDKHKIVDRKMKPWVTKKIMEYLGEEEKTLIDFIMNKITAHTPPNEMLTALVPILDEEADIFVVKMWRMLVYEMFTAAKS